MPNQLKHARSPYLRQHENNPVHWHEWNEETLELAKKSNKLILVSIGYSACHWCHVMAHESFEDEATAQIMNAHFINIKIDREERPDLDAIYMDACQLVTRSGGWPLNAFALPDGSPFHAGTYFPKAQWQKILSQIAQLWISEPNKVLEYSLNLKKGIEQVSDFIPEKEPSNGSMDTAIEKIITQLDTYNGGMKGAPKFPMPTLWNFLIDPLLHQKTAQNHAIFTLEQMRLGGIYDWVEGGFARYAVDERWFAPHFEKMLYDNAQLISLYCKAYAITGNEVFKTIAEACGEYVLAEWKAEDAGFFSAYDADSEGVEGKYYCFTHDEINHLKLDNESLFKQYFQISEKGNWEHDLNILYPILTESEFASNENIQDFKSLLKLWRDQLNKARNNKIKPGIDDKQNTTWNALLLSAFCHLSQINASQQWRESARSLFGYMKQKPYLMDGSLSHMVHKKEAYISAFFEDYAHCIASLINYFEIFSDQNSLDLAMQLGQEVNDLFFDEASGFYKTAQQNKIIRKKIEITDNVIPSANSVMCENLLKLGLIRGKDKWFHQGEGMLEKMKDKALMHPQHYANWCRILSIQQNGYPYVVSNKHGIQVNRHKAWMNLVWHKELSDIHIFTGKDFSNKDVFYYCANKVCHAPVSNSEDIRYA